MESETPMHRSTNKGAGFRPAVLAIVSILCLAGGVWLGRGPLARRAEPADAADRARQLFTCGMHPQVIQDHPGACPICGMALTPVRSQAGASGPGDLSIAIDPVTTQNMGIRTDIVRKGPLRRAIRTIASIDFDETALADVTTKFRGWIEKLHVDATGQLVHRGDPLFDIYSPDLVSAQTEYLLAIDDKTGALAGMKAGAFTRLKYFDISDDQIAEIQRTRQVRKTLRIDAPRDGAVVEKLAVEGQMVADGMRLYRIADLGTVWVKAQVFEQDLPFIRVGQEARVSLAYLPGRSFRGRVTFIYPTVDEKTRTVQVRMEFHNPGYFLKPGMFATVHLTAELTADAVLVPDTAVLRSGEQNTVFVALQGGRFEPRTVVLGPRGEDRQYQVLSGLSGGERVVTSGQFMLDSESQLREAISRMTAPGASAPVLPAGNATGGAPAAVTGAVATAYVCPMPEHVAILYAQAGSCPLCGMALVPVNAEQRTHLVPGAAIDFYTCPMPEDAGVRSSKPGKCPRCGMTLIPVMKSPAPPAAPPEAAAPVLYTCPMAEDADVVADHPGSCPKCGMKLVATGTVAHGAKAVAEWRRSHPREH